MLILGINGGIHGPGDRPVTLPIGAMTHDAAAVLLEDGEVVAAIEEERLNRIKHTYCAPSGAIRFCLESRGISLDDVDHIAFYATQRSVDTVTRQCLLMDATLPRFSGPEKLLEIVKGASMGDLRPEKLVFVGHHLAHAVSAYAMSGFDEALVATFDGSGEGIAGTIWVARQGDLEQLRTISNDDSLGWFYQGVIRYLGYRIFDEYKVMGLAPYGDPSQFRAAFQRLFTLRPDGQFSLHRDRLPVALSGLPPRRTGEPFVQAHKNLAATLQETLEIIVMHVLQHFREQTGMRSLALAGGVAHNCTMNGHILRSGLFDRMFVQPAAHDAGCALGAALHAHRLAVGQYPRRKISNLYWGSPVGDARQISERLQRWGNLVEIEALGDTAARAAALIADGSVVGWVQGKSEFGPRALGNRSILADPRRAENKQIINDMIKKREGYRPFAPAVLEERAAELFELTPDLEIFRYMIFVVPVREAYQSVLQAVTHVDGTARVQTVSRDSNPAFWQLIHELGKLTGVPVILNTSFNNNAEPIVDSVDDALVCYLTTELSYLVVGDYLITRRNDYRQAIESLVLGLPPHIEVHAIHRARRDREYQTAYEARNIQYNNDAIEISRDLFDVLLLADGRRSLAELADDTAPADRSALLAEVWTLWARRMIRLRPH